MDDKDGAQAYLDGMIAEAEQRKADNKMGLYRMNAKISHNTALLVESYFTKPGYRIEVKQCFSCKKTYDLLVFF